MTSFMIGTPMMMCYVSYYYAIKLKRNKKRAQNAMNFHLIIKVLYIFYPYLEILKWVLFEF
ncbi:hypothetical protein HpNP83_11230 [Helicobacter pylori]